MPMRDMPELVRHDGEHLLAGQALDQRVREHHAAKSWEDAHDRRVRDEAVGRPDPDLADTHPRAARELLEVVAQLALWKPREPEQRGNHDRHDEEEREDADEAAAELRRRLMLGEVRPRDRHGDLAEHDRHDQRRDDGNHARARLRDHIGQPRRNRMERAARVERADRRRLAHARLDRIRVPVADEDRGDAAGEEIRRDDRATEGRRQRRGQRARRGHRHEQRADPA